MPFRNHDRDVSLDAARGVAMLLVCVSHFGVFFQMTGDVTHQHVAELIGWPATATFFMLSGLVVSAASCRSDQQMALLWRKLVGRGLFLLLPGHAILAVAHAAAFGDTHFVFVTDAIGVSLVVGPLIIMRTGLAQRAAVGAMLIAVSWWVYLRWHPSIGSQQVLRFVLFGHRPMQNGWLTFPLLPWLGAYLLTTVIATRIEQARAEGDRSRAVVKLAVILIASSLLVYLLGHLADLGTIRLLTSGFQKYPPGPAYLLGGSGAGLLILHLLEECRTYARLAPVIERFAVVGRASLVVFIAQYVLFYFVLWRYYAEISSWWPIYFIMSCWGLYLLASLWTSRIGNGWLTLNVFDWPFFQRHANGAKARSRIER